MEDSPKDLPSVQSLSMTDIVDIGNRLELLVDRFLIDRLAGGARQQLHHPIPREVSLVTDRPWEGNACAYITVFQDGSLYRMYYKGWHIEAGQGHEGPLHICYAHSDDGKRWSRPDLGMYEFEQSRKNNITWLGEGADALGTHGFSPFRDDNPACAPDARYKAVGAPRKRTRGRLHAAASADGIHWRLLHPDPVITAGAFDSQNLAFWDSHRGEYRAYIRDFHNGVRGIKTATSSDFIHWTDPQWLEYPGSPEEQLYTNQVTPYPRAPHLFVGFPTRYSERGWGPGTEALPELEHRRLRATTHPRYGMAVTDGLFMTSRDGRTFHRHGEAFIRPGLRTEGNWVYGDNYQNWGVVQTRGDLPGSPDELSFYATEGYWRGRSNIIRRYTLRMDGFVSVNAPLAGGELLTRPLRFSGSRLHLNFSTSGAGGVRIEIQHPDGSVVEGFGLADSPEMYGDALEYTALWRDPDALRKLAGQPVRLRFVLKDADLYAIRFGD